MYPGLNERIKTRAKHLEKVIFIILSTFFYVQIVAKLAANFAVNIVMSKKDELGPSARKAFNQSEEMLELNVEVKDAELKMYLKYLLPEYLQRRDAREARRKFSMCVIFLSYLEQSK